VRRGLPPPVADQFQALLDSLQSNVGRYVAFVLTPILLPLVGAAAYWLQDVAGVDLQADPAVVTAYIVAVVGGLAGVLITWMRNRGNHERAAVETLTVLKAGEDAAAAERQNVATGSGSGAAVWPSLAGPVSPDREFGGPGSHDPLDEPGS
jgi:hypothetical protein